MKIISWNTGKKSSNEQKDAILEIISDEKPDIFIFQECIGAFLIRLIPNTYYEIPYPARTGIDRRVRIFILKQNYKHRLIENKINNKLICVNIENLKSKETFNLAAIHLYSKVNNTEREQMWKNIPFFKEIEDFEKTTRNYKSIIAGDFNYNPYEKDHFDSKVINSLSSLKMINFLDKSQSFTRPKNMWYNPMWNILGDYDFAKTKRKVNGTYYRFSDNESHPFWNMFDGFLVRPVLAKKIRLEDLYVITKTNRRNFIKQFVITEKESFIDERISDHLPVSIEINL